MKIESVNFYSNILKDAVCIRYQIFDGMHCLYIFNNMNNVYHDGYNIHSRLRYATDISSIINFFKYDTTKLSFIDIKNISNIIIPKIIELLELEEIEVICEINMVQ